MEQIDATRGYGLCTYMQSEHVGRRAFESGFIGSHMMMMMSMMMLMTVVVVVVVVIRMMMIEGQIISLEMKA